jgi:hypothetical protein
MRMLAQAPEMSPVEYEYDPYFGLPIGVAIVVWITISLGLVAFVALIAYLFLRKKKESEQLPTHVSSYSDLPESTPPTRFSFPRLPPL